LGLEQEELGPHWSWQTQRGEPKNLRAPAGELNEDEKLRSCDTNSKEGKMNNTQDTKISFSIENQQD
jgi:hypothetical protein